MDNVGTLLNGTLATIYFFLPKERREEGGTKVTPGPRLGKTRQWNGGLYKRDPLHWIVSAAAHYERIVDGIIDVGVE